MVDRASQNMTLNSQVSWHESESQARSAPLEKANANIGEKFTGNSACSTKLIALIAQNTHSRSAPEGSEQKLEVDLTMLSLPVTGYKPVAGYMHVRTENVFG